MRWMLAWLLAGLNLWAQSPVELGKVPWERNLEKATAESKRSHKPVLLLFQEVPG